MVWVIFPENLLDSKNCWKKEVVQGRRGGGGGGQVQLLKDLLPVLLLTR